MHKSYEKILAVGAILIFVVVLILFSVGTARAKGGGGAGHGSGAGRGSGGEAGHGSGDENAPGEPSPSGNRPGSGVYGGAPGHESTRSSGGSQPNSRWGSFALAGGGLVVLGGGFTLWRRIRG